MVRASGFGLAAGLMRRTAALWVCVVGLGSVVGGCVCGAGRGADAACVHESGADTNAGAGSNGQPLAPIAERQVLRQPRWRPEVPGDGCAAGGRRSDFAGDRAGCEPAFPATDGEDGRRDCGAGAAFAAREGPRFSVFDGLQPGALGRECAGGCCKAASRCGCGAGAMEDEWNGPLEERVQTACEPAGLADGGYAGAGRAAGTAGDVGGDGRCGSGE